MTTSSIVEMAMHMREATGNAEHSDAFLAGLEKREAEREAERKEQRRADEAKHEAQRRADEAQRRADEAERKEQHRADEAQRRVDQDRFILAMQREFALQRWFFVAAVAIISLVVAAIAVA